MPWVAPKKESRKRMHPLWSGLGVILAPVYAIGSYYLAQAIVRGNMAEHWVYIPGAITPFQQTIAVTLAMCALLFSLVAILWGIVRGPIGGPTDIHYSKYRRLKKRY